MTIVELTINDETYYINTDDVCFAKYLKTVEDKKYYRIQFNRMHLDLEASDAHKIINEIPEN